MSHISFRDRIISLLEAYSRPPILCLHASSRWMQSCSDNGLLQGPSETLRQLVFAGCAWFFAGAEFFLFVSLAPEVVRQLRLAPYGQGFILSHLALGNVLGCLLLGGPSADLFGRLSALRLSYGGALVGCALCAAAGSAGFLGGSLVLLGAALGAGQVAWIVMCSENTQPRWRLAMLSTTLLVYVIGSAWGFLVFIMFGGEGEHTFEYEWRWLVMTGLMPLFVLMPIFLALADESRVYADLCGSCAESNNLGSTIQDTHADAKDAAAPNAADLLAGTAVSVTKSSRASIANARVEYCSGNFLPTTFAVYQEAMLGTTLVVTYTCFVVFFVLCASFVESSQSMSGSDMLVAMLWQVPSIYLSPILGQYTSRRSLLQLLLIVVGCIQLAGAALSSEVGPHCTRLFAGAGVPVIIAWSAEIYSIDLRARGVAASLAASQFAVASSTVIFHALKERVPVLRLLCATLCLVNVFVLEFLPKRAAGENAEEEYQSADCAHVGSYGAA